jgi:hypothetical protein
VIFMAGGDYLPAIQNPSPQEIEPGSRFPGRLGDN